MPRGSSKWRCSVAERSGISRTMSRSTFSISSSCASVSPSPSESTSSTAESALEEVDSDGDGLTDAQELEIEKVDRLIVLEIPERSATEHRHLLEPRGILLDDHLRTLGQSAIRHAAVGGQAAGGQWRGWIEGVHGIHPHVVGEVFQAANADYRVAAQQLLVLVDRIGMSVGEEDHRVLRARGRLGQARIRTCGGDVAVDQRVCVRQRLDEISGIPVRLPGGEVE